MKNIVVIYHGKCPDGFSAAWIAWKKFGDDAEYIPGRHGEIPPEDLDIWKLELPDVFAVAMVVNSIEQDFDTWTKLVKDFDDESTRNQQIEQGKIMLKYENKLIDEIMNSNREI